MWSTFSKTQSPNIQKALVPGEFSAITAPKTITDAEGGIELVAADATNNVRFINLAVAPTADANGDPISIYIGIGFIPTSVLYSFEILSGDNVHAMQINGQQIKAICEAGKTLEVNIQLALGISKTL